jgi:peptidoglycan/LPS O-acetylase OafA/YrhL
MEKIAPLTGLRGIAAYAVLIAHAVDASVSGRGLPHSIAVGLAYFGMSLFFVLSGFVICYNYENKVLSPYGRWQFFGARFARLFPMYAFVVIVYALPVLDHSTPLVVVTHATLTQSWFNTEEAYFGATWSISTEWFFYFAFVYLISSPRLQAFAGWKPLAAFSAASVLALAVLFVLKPQIEWLFSRPLHPLFLHGGASNTIWTWLSYYSPMVRILEFMLGVIAARTYSALRPDVPSWAAFLAFGWCALLIAFGQQFLANTFFGNFLPNFVFAPALVVIMLYVSQDRTIAFVFLSGAIMVWAGEISYSVYLLQAAGRNIALFFVQHPALDILLTCFFTTIIASTSFILIERPSRTFLRRLFTRWAEVVP